MSKYNIVIASPVLALQMLYKKSLDEEIFDFSFIENIDDLNENVFDRETNLIILDHDILQDIDEPQLKRLREVIYEIPTIGVGTQEDDLNFLKELGCNVTLQKPIDLKLLKEKVTEFLPGQYLAKGLAGETRTEQVVIQLKKTLDEIKSFIWRNQNNLNFKVIAGRLRRLADQIENIEVKKEARPVRVAGNQLIVRLMRCPVCSNHFEAVNVNNALLKPGRVHADSYIEYEGINPLLYEICVCPKCLFAAKEKDFRYLRKEPKVVEKISSERMNRMKYREKLKFAPEREPEEALAAYYLAVSCARHYKQKAYLGKLYLKASWLCRMQGRKEEEKINLQNALDNFRLAYDAREYRTNSQEEAEIIYLMGEISLKLGKYSESAKYFDIILLEKSGNISAELLKLTRAERERLNEERKLRPEAEKKEASGRTEKEPDAGSNVKLAFKRKPFEQLKDHEL